MSLEPGEVVMMITLVVFALYINSREEADKSDAQREREWNVFLQYRWVLVLLFVLMFAFFFISPMLDVMGLLTVLLLMTLTMIGAISLAKRD